MEKYQVLGQIGEGTYGIVHKVRRYQDKGIYSIKKFKYSDRTDAQVRKTAAREIHILRRLDHLNILKVYEVFRHPVKTGNLHLVLEYSERSLLDELLMHPHGLPSETLTTYMYQLVSAIAYCHARNIIHRDIKPENVLINQKGVLKLCDFGFARDTSEEMSKPSEGPLTDYVSTRWYRSPELLLGDENYHFGVDIWAIGCIFAEMASGDPLFQGTSDADQIRIIISCFGQLPKYYTEMLSKVPETLKVNSAMPASGSSFSWAQRELHKRLPSLSQQALSVIASCLVYDPVHRSTSAEIIKHPYFASIRRQVMQKALLLDAQKQLKRKETKKKKRNGSGGSHRNGSGGRTGSGGRSTAAASASGYNATRSKSHSGDARTAATQLRVKARNRSKGSKIKTPKSKGTPRKGSKTHKGSKAQTPSKGSKSTETKTAFTAPLHSLAGSRRKKKKAKKKKKRRKKSYTNSDLITPMLMTSPDNGEAASGRAQPPKGLAGGATNSVNLPPTPQQQLMFGQPAPLDQNYPLDHKTETRHIQNLPILSSSFHEEFDRPTLHGAQRSTCSLFSSTEGLMAPPLLVRSPRQQEPWTPRSGAMRAAARNLCLADSAMSPSLPHVGGTTPTSTIIISPIRSEKKNLPTS